MNRSLIFALLMSVLPLSAQNVSQDKAAALSQIEKNNTTLAALRQKAVADKQQNAIGNALPDPRVGFSNTWGNQPGSVTKQNFSIEQDLDWGTISGLRNKTSKSNNIIADLNYLVERQTLLSEADRLIVQLIYNNALCEEYDYRVTRAAELKQLFEKKFAAGDANQLELNKVRLNFTALVAEQRRAQAQREEAEDQLTRLNGNQPLSFTHSKYDKVILPPFAELAEKAQKQAPQMELVRSIIDREQHLLKLNKAEGLPSLSIGYLGEVAKGDNSNGVSIGMSIPIWGNSRKKVSYQRAAITLAEMEKKDIETQINATLSRQYTNANSLCQISDQFRKELTENEDIELLDKALNAGQLSLIDYLNEITFYYSARTQALEAERDSQLAVSSLWDMFR